MSSKTAAVLAENKRPCRNYMLTNYTVFVSGCVARFDVNRTDAVTEPPQTRESHDVMQIEHECAGKAIWHYRIPRLYLATLWNVDAICCGSGVISPSAPCSLTKKSCCHQRSGCEKSATSQKITHDKHPQCNRGAAFSFIFYVIKIFNLKSIRLIWKKAKLLKLQCSWNHLENVQFKTLLSVLGRF